MKNPLTVSLDQIERNEVSSQELTLNEWMQVRSRIELLRLRLEAHIMDARIFGG
jgi:hypothetical protein